LPSYCGLLLNAKVIGITVILTVSLQKGMSKSAQYAEDRL